MRKLVIIITVFSFLLISKPAVSEERNLKKSVNEDTVTESVWDWMTTLGKSPERKQRIKQEHRLKRAKKRTERDKKIREEKLRRQNEARVKEAEESREARIRSQRKKIQIRKRQIEKEMKRLEAENRKSKQISIE